MKRREAPNARPSLDVYKRQQEDCRVRIFCMNPANQIQARIAHGISAIYFSATQMCIRDRSSRIYAS